MPQRGEMDFYTRADIEQSFRRIEEIIDCGIFERQNSGNPLVQSALTELLIRLRDLMAKSRIFAEPVDFQDDVNKTDRVNNVADAIKFVRDAICHIDSEKHYHEECNARMSYNIAYGKCILAKIGDVEIKSDYEDDVCFFFGNQKLYLKRHVIRAYREAKDKLGPIIEEL